MKRIFVILPLFLLFVAPYNAKSISYKNKELSLIAFNVTISPQMLAKLNALDGQFPEARDPKINKIIKKIKDMSWGIIEGRLEQEVGMYILPLNTYGKQYDYDEYEYPNTNINKAIRRGNSKYYMRIDMAIDFEEIASPSAVSSAIKFITDTTDKTKPIETTQPKARVTISVTTYTDKGIMPKDKFTGFFIANEPWSFETPLLDGLVNDKPFDDTKTLMGLVNNSVTTLIVKFLM